MSRFYSPSPDDADSEFGVFILHGFACCWSFRKGRAYFASWVCLLAYVRIQSQGQDLEVFSTFRANVASSLVCWTSYGRDLTGPPLLFAISPPPCCATSAAPQEKRALASVGVESTCRAVPMKYRDKTKYSSLVLLLSFTSCEASTPRSKFKIVFQD